MYSSHFHTRMYIVMDPSAQIHTHRQKGVSYFNPQVQHWDVRMIPIEREAKEHSDVLLFVVCGDTLSVASMVEVAYYTGAGRKMVLCLVDISCDGGTEIEGMKVSTMCLFMVIHVHTSPADTFTYLKDLLFNRPIFALLIQYNYTVLVTCTL